MTESRSGSAHGPVRSRGRLRYGALSGMLAAAVALGVGQLAAAAVRPRAAPVIAVGGAVIDGVPTPVKEWAVRTFGTADKPVLIAGILLAVGLVAAAAGVLAMRDSRAGLAVVTLLGAVGVATALAAPGAGAGAAVPSVTAALAGGVALTLLVHAGRAATASSRPEPRAEVAEPAGRPAVESRSHSRRRFLLTGLAGAGVALASGGAGRAALQRRWDVNASRAAVGLPAPASPAQPLPPGARLRIPGLTPLFSPNRRFYRVDTALIVPRVSAEEWSLRVHGMVDRPMELSLRQLLSRPLVERDITLSCVSNEVGGSLVDTARWIGVPLAGLLREAGVGSGADQLVSRSTDGMTIGTPTEVVMDGRDAMLAVAMNGEPLPPEHGFPVRMLVPGLYGYVSATKWVTELELTTFDAYDPYWVRRGWAARAPVKTASRIDTPRPLASLESGRVPVAGVAWAQHRGIRRVEVRIDERQWHRARLSAPVNKNVWRQWVYEWNATPGTHRLEVRATDGTGVTQPERRTPPFPDGATGWHSIDVTVAR